MLPDYVIHPEEPMEEIVHKFQKSGKYNIPVIQEGKYLGYLSRANVFSAYRAMMSEISEDWFFREECAENLILRKKSRY